MKPGFGFWEVDLVNNTIFWSERVFTIHCVTPQEYTPDLQSAIEFYHPDDRHLVEEALASAIESKGSFEFELRLVQKNPRELVRWVRSKGRIILDPEENPVGLYGIFEDITEEKALEEQIEIILAGPRIGLWDWNLDAGIISTNEAAKMLLKRDPSSESLSYTSEQFFERIHPEDKSTVQASLDLVFEDDAYLYDVEFRYLNELDQYQWIRSIGKIIERRADHSPRRMVGPDSRYF